MPNKPMRLPPLKVLRVRNPNKPEINPCVTVMSTVLSTSYPFSRRQDAGGGCPLERELVANSCGHRQHAGPRKATPQPAARSSSRHCVTAWTVPGCHPSPTTPSTTTFPGSRSELRARSRRRSQSSFNRMIDGCMLGQHRFRPGLADFLGMEVQYRLMRDEDIDDIAPMGVCWSGMLLEGLCIREASVDAQYLPRPAGKPRGGDS